MYAVVRTVHIALFILASRDELNLRQSVIGLGISTAIASGLLVGASFADGALQGGLILIIALGESIVAIGVGAEEQVDAPPAMSLPRGWRQRNGALASGEARRSGRRCEVPSVEPTRGSSCS
jgi:multisubunit Na+/H+ antiporter MnhB subunit